MVTLLGIFFIDYVLRTGIFLKKVVFFLLFSESNLNGFVLKSTEKNQDRLLLFS